MKYLAFDLETAKILPEHVTDLLAHRPLGICCAAAVSGDFPSPEVWYGRQPDGTPAPRMTSQEANALVCDLRSFVERGYTLVTWNGLNFDFNVLAEESGLWSECADLAMNHVDMMFHVMCALGYFVGLDNVARAMGVEGKTIGTRGYQAPALWAEGRQAEVIAYNVRDAQTTFDVAVECECAATLRWITHKGRLAEMPLQKGWLQVKDARLMPLPDTSWMTDPPRRPDFFRWFPSPP